MSEPQTLKLPDGRKLSFTEFGQRGDHPVFYFHGVPASYYEAALVGEEEFRKRGLWIIAANRPGVGRSDYQPQRTFHDWPKDVLALAEHLKIDRFAVLGNSGGAAYVVACALQIPHQLTAAVIVSGAWQMNQPEAIRNLSRPNRLFWQIAARMPFLLKPLLSQMRPADLSRDELLGRFRKMMLKVDYDVVEQGDRAMIAAQTLAGGLTQLQGAEHEVRLYVKPSGFDTKSLNMPITFFHGEKDKNVPIELVRKMLQDLPHAKLVTYPDDAHLSTLCDHFDEISGVLIESSGENWRAKSTN